MGLAAAVSAIDRRVQETRRIRYHCLRGEPPAQRMPSGALAHWVDAELAAGHLTLLESGVLDIAGRWNSFRFCCSHA